MIWCLSEPGRRHTWNFSLKWLDVSLCWDPQMKSCIVDFKIDSELNSVSQNSPFVTPRWKIQVWATISQGDPPPNQVVKTPALSLFPLSHSTPSTHSTSALPGLLSASPTGLPALKISSSGPNKLWRATSCIASRPKELLLTAATQDPANLRMCGTSSTLAPSCYPCKWKERPVSSSADFHQPWHSKNSIAQHRNPNILLQPPAPFLHRLVTWAGL